MYFSKDFNGWTALGAKHTAAEVAQQPKTWLKTFDIIDSLQDSLGQFLEDITKDDNHDIILTGAGTSEFVGNTVQPVLAKGHKLNVRSVATTDLVADPSLYFNKVRPTLLVSFGRSGNSPESVAAVEVANQLIDNVKHLVITCNHEGNLAMREDENIFAIKLPEETNDKSLAMTSSYSNMYLATILAFNLDKLDTLKEDLEVVAKVGTHFNEEAYKDVTEMVDSFDFSRIVYLGDGRHNGLAQECGLKLLELTAGQTVSMHNTPLGFRHGPKSFINAETLIVVFMQSNEYIRKYQKDLIKEVSIQRNGEKLLVIDTQEDTDVASLVDKYVHINYNTNITQGLEVLNMVMYGQLFSVLKSIKLGLEPDNPSPSGVINRVVEGVIIYDFKED